jgi:hypothetical protein
LFSPFVLDLIHHAACLKKTWCSPIYGFFKASIDIGYNNGCKYHYFKCVTKKCKTNGGVQHYQDSKDHAATSNLKTHALKCFRVDAVTAACKKKDAVGCDGSIFASFAHFRQQPIKFTHCIHTTDETQSVS